MRGLLSKIGAGHIKIVGGGGGVIYPRKKISRIARIMDMSEFIPPLDMVRSMGCKELIKRFS